MEGLRRLEYRGYDSAGVALVSRRAPTIVGDKRAGKLANLEKALADTPLPRLHDRHRAHPLGDPRRAHRPQRPPAPRAGRPGRGGAQRDHRELRRAARRARARRPRAASRTPTPRSPRTCSRPRSSAGADLTTAMQRGLPAGSRARSRWWPSTPHDPEPGGRRPPQLPARRRPRRRRELPRPPTSRRSSSTPATPSSSARTRSSRSPATASTVTDFDGEPAEGRPYHVDWDLSAAEKGGYDWFMRKEIDEQPRAIADTLLGPPRRGRPAPARRDADQRGGAPRRRQDHHHRLRHRLLRRPGREVRHRALDPDPVRGRARPRVPLPRPDPDPRHAGRRDQPVRRDRRHADGDPARPRAARRRCSRSATPTARRSRASPTR